MTTSSARLNDGSRVAVIGGGPAGSFFAYLLLQFAETAGLHLQVDIYEPRNFGSPGPCGCNMCGGVISETLVQTLTEEGFQLSSSIVQRAIDSYVLHMDVGRVRIEPPISEQRIAAVNRGGGPRGMKGIISRSFDAYLLSLALSRGA
ncbi:MAG: hypothetical protein HY646_21650, partial [Acidobacteria bacterium]|nr:hypothetical protein [Acidobacteriota bacterium]